MLSEFIHFTKYARFLEHENRRETFNETVDRNLDMHISRFPQYTEELNNAYKVVYDKKALPSMRSMQFAGKAVMENNARLYNCSFLHAKDTEFFGEVMFLLLSGVGVGYSVQEHHVNKLPDTPLNSECLDEFTYTIDDSIGGWKDAVNILIKSFFSSTQVNFDYSAIRPKGSRLKTSGGLAPGFQVLKDCLDNLELLLKSIPKGYKLRPIDVHDAVCIIADSVLAGGIRRSACISLFDAHNKSLLNCKGVQQVENLRSIRGVDKNHHYVLYTQYDDFFSSLLGYGNNLAIDKIHSIPSSLLKQEGEHTLHDKIMNCDTSIDWWLLTPYRARANNSAVLLRGKVSEKLFKSIIQKTYESHAGEPGIFWTNDVELGTNPCAEISLNAFQFCNLVELDVSKPHTYDEYVQIAKSITTIATFQATFTNFDGLRKEWQIQTEKEALIGVSLTGLASTTLSDTDLSNLAQVVLDTNKEWALKLGINPSARCTTIKPSGTASLVFGCSSGVHAYHAPYYLRRIRLNKGEPVYKFLKTNIPNNVEDCLMNPDLTGILTVAIKSPANSIVRTSENWLDFLERVLFYNRHWIQKGHRSGINHNNVSCTANIPDDESTWKQVADWLWLNKDEYTAISLLPAYDSVYLQPPFEDCDIDTYNSFATFNDIDLSKVIEFEDNANKETELVCSGGSCEIY